MAVRVKQYVVVAKANTPQRPTPAVPNRVMLLIQNTGANPGLVRFVGEVRQDGGDIVLAAGAFSPLWDQKDSTPNDALNFFSTAGTTFAVLEMVEV